MNNTYKYCAAADMPASKRNEKLKCPPPTQTAAREPVFARHAETNERNQIMKTVAYSGHFYTTPNLVRPPGAEIEEGNLLVSNSFLTNSTNVDPLPQTAAREPVFVRHADINFYTTPDLVRPPGAEIEDGNLISPRTAARDPVFARREDPQSSRTTAQLPSFPAFFTQSMSVLSGSGEAGDPDLIAHVVSTNWGRVINRDSTRRGPVIKR
jgi:hypothetical protein